MPRSGIAYAEQILTQQIRSREIRSSDLIVFWIPGEDFRMRTRLRLRYGDREHFAFFEREWLQNPARVRGPIVNTVTHCLERVTADD